MGPETNIKSILALEKQIQEGTGDVIQLRRARNSLLNISAHVPPEILGHIFRWNVIREGDFGGLEKGSYNFLLVCHHWFQVASNTPELWTFWGNTLDQWSRHYQHFGTAPLDLVLDAPNYPRNTNNALFDNALRNALQDLAARDSIRSIHLRGSNTFLLGSVIFSLILGGEDIRCSNIESLIVQSTELYISDFLARYRFPKLRHFHLSVFIGTLSWDQLKLQAPSLTTLSLEFGVPQSSSTMPKLLSILASYPDLQHLSLYEAMIPRDVNDGSTFRVPLRRLKTLHLVGDFRPVFRLLDRLEYPDTLDHLDLELLKCAAEEISEYFVPYLQDRIRRDGRFRDRLGIHAASTLGSISFKIDAIDDSAISAVPPGVHGHSFLSFRAMFRDTVPQDTVEKLCVALAALAPRENVVCLTWELSIHDMENLVIAMPNIEALHLIGPVISDPFLQPDPSSCTKLLPSLRWLSLVDFTLQNSDDWSPLINYLAHQTSGGKPISLGTYGEHTPLPPEVAKEIEGVFGARDILATRIPNGDGTLGIDDIPTE